MTDFHSLYQLYAPQVRRFALFLSGDEMLAIGFFYQRWKARGTE